MKKGCAIASGVFVVLLLAAVLVADWRYGLLFPASRIPYADIASDRTAVRIRIDPAMARELIQRRYLDDSAVPSWAVPLVLPYEAAVLVAPDLNQRAAGVVVFVNERRAGPLLAQLATGSGALERPAGQIRWEPPALVSERRGSLLLEGSMPLSAEVVALVREHWGIVKPLSPLDVETPAGTHFVEGVVDLRDGRGFAVLAQLLGHGQPPSSPLHPGQLVYLMNKLSWARFSVDLTSPEVLTLVLTLECRPEMDDADAQSTAFLLNTIQGQAAEGLRQQGMALEGTAEAEGLTVRGEYRLDGYQRLLGG